MAFQQATHPEIVGHIEQRLLRGLRISPPRGKPGGEILRERVDIGKQQVIDGFGAQTAFGEVLIAFCVEPFIGRGNPREIGVDDSGRGRARPRERGGERSVKNGMADPTVTSPPEQRYMYAVEPPNFFSRPAADAQFIFFPIRICHDGTKQGDRAKRFERA